jgi:hypothetical protein
MGSVALTTGFLVRSDLLDRWSAARSWACCAQLPERSIVPGAGVQGPGFGNLLRRLVRFS